MEAVCMANPWLVLVRIVLFGRVMSLWLLEALLPYEYDKYMRSHTHLYTYIGDLRVQMIDGIWIS